MPFDLIAVGDLLGDDGARAEISGLNALGQVPVLRLPSGTIMTESAAITLHLADLSGSEALVPGPQRPERADFLRWLVFIVANIYPTFTYGDVPGRFVVDPVAALDFRQRVDRHAEMLWRQVAAAAVGPWFLGERFSALDIYLAVMGRWRPGPVWFAAATPILADIAARTAARPELRAVLMRNFPDWPI